MSLARFSGKENKKCQGEGKKGEEKKEDV